MRSIEHFGRSINTNRLPDSHSVNFPSLSRTSSILSFDLSLRPFFISAASSAVFEKEIGISYIISFVPGISSPSDPLIINGLWP